MIRWLVLVAMVVLGVADDAYCCNRCGRFRGCKYCNNSYVAVAPVVYKQPDLLIVQNNYPQPNGVAALAQQGNTQYGLSAALQYRTVDPAAQLYSYSQLASSMGQAAQQATNGFGQAAQLQLGLQAQLAEPLVKSNAAAQVLTAAGLNQQAFTAPQSFALKVTIGADGKPIVESMNAQEVNSRITGRTEPVGQQPGTQDPPPDPQAPVANSMLSVKCGACHGTNKSTPAGGLFIDAGVSLACKDIPKAVRAVRDNKMPKNGSLTPEEKGQILEELLASEQAQ